MSDESSQTHLAFFWVLGGAGWLGFAHWSAMSIGALLTGREFNATAEETAVASIDILFRRIPIEEAWGQELAPIGLLWPLFFVVVGFTAAAGYISYNVLFGKKWGIKDRDVLGVDAEAAFASKKELIGLETKLPLHGRFLLGEFHGRTLATENGEAAKSLRTYLNSPRTYGRGAVAVIGPSQCGKTSAVLAAILEWDGPAILISVKDDLFGAIPERRRRGPTVIFDPTGRIQRAFHGRKKRGEMVRPGYDPAMICGWTPLRMAATFNGAQKAAAKLVDARPDAGGGERSGYWAFMAGQLLTGYFYVAANSPGHDMASVVRWVKQNDGPTDEGSGVVESLLSDLEARSIRDPSIDRADVSRARDELTGIWKAPGPTKGSVFAQAQTLISGWSTAEAAASATTNTIDLEWLLDGSDGPRSLFVTAPQEDMKRLSTLFGGLVNDMLDQVFQYNLDHPDGFEKPLLLVIDEASKVPLEELPGYASTVAGLGVQLVTVWQTRNQIDRIYGGPGAGELLSNHITKLVFPGLEEKDVEYMAKLIGEHYDMTNTEMSDMYNRHRGSVQTSESVRNLAPTHTIRQMAAGTALLVHGALPPAQIKVLSCYENRRFKRKLKWRERKDSTLGLPPWACGVIDVRESSSMFDGMGVSGVSMSDKAKKGEL